MRSEYYSAIGWGAIIGLFLTTFLPRLEIIPIGYREVIAFFSLFFEGFVIGQIFLDIKKDIEIIAISGMLPLVMSAICYSIDPFYYLSPNFYIYYLSWFVPSFVLVIGYRIWKSGKPEY